MTKTPENTATEKEGGDCPAAPCSATFALHGFRFYTSEERQSAARSHPLWNDYLAWDRRRHCGVPDMDDDHDREVFEAYIEGAFRQLQNAIAQTPPESGTKNHG